MKKFVARIGSLVLGAMLVLTSIFSSGTIETVAAGSVKTATLDKVMMVTPTQIALVFGEGYIEYGGFFRLSNSVDRVYRAHLNETEASNKDNYLISSSDDANYATAVTPKSVFRKSKLNGVADDKEIVNGTVQHQALQQHRVYLNLDKPLVEGKKYTISISSDKLNSDKTTYEFVMNSRAMVSESIHTSTVGYLPESNAKYAYISEWAGDGGAADLSSLEGANFYLINKTTGQAVYNGKVTYRASKENKDGSVATSLPSFSLSDVYECNFSNFRTESGDTEFVISVDGVGISAPFKISTRAFDEAFYVAARGIYHQRNGIALDREYTEWARPRNYHPDDGFKVTYGKGSGQFLDDVWGWYSDAGDNDGYSSHLIVPRYLMLTYEMKPSAFKDGELNIPESGNGIPDLLDEAAWLLNFAKRAKGPTGGATVRITSENDGAPNPYGSGSQNNKSVSWEDKNVWWIEPENVDDTWEYASLAAQYAYCLDLAKGGKAADSDSWIKEAKDAYDWACNKVNKPTGETQMRKYTAAAWLYKYTGEQKYLTDVESLVASMAGRVTNNTLPLLCQWGTWALATSDKYAAASESNYNKVRENVIKWGNTEYDTAFGKENSIGVAFRYSIPVNMPQCIGNGTTPFVAASIVAHSITGEPKYLDTIESTSNYTLGANPLNTVWMTGLNEYSTKAVFKIDWHAGEYYNGKGYEDGYPGIVAYGIDAMKETRDDSQSSSMYNASYAYYHDIYPSIKEWPSHELNFNSRYAIMTAEFTIHQNQAPATAAFGYLSSTSKITPERPGNVNKNLVQPYHVGTVKGNTTKISNRYFVNGAKITVYNGKKAIGSATVKNNKYTVKIKPQPAGSKLTMKATKATWKTSPVKTLTKKLSMRSVKVKKVTKKSKYISGTAAPKSKVVVKLGKQVVASGKVKANGNYKIKVKASIKKNAKFKKGAKLVVTTTYKKFKKTAKVKVK